MMNYRLTYNGPSGFDYTGFHTEQEALLWAASQEQLNLIKALSLMKYDEGLDTYKVISDLSDKPVDIPLPNTGHNRQYYLLYYHNNELYGLLVEAPSIRSAERYFQSKKPTGKIMHIQESDNLEINPGTPVLVLTEKEEKELRIRFLASHIEELDLTVRAYNSLRRGGVEFIRELICKTEDELKQMPSMGRKCIDEIITVLGLHGEQLLQNPEQSRKPSLDSMLRSIAYYSDNDAVRDNVLQSDILREQTLRACHHIPGYSLLSKDKRNDLYDLVKQAVSLANEKEMSTSDYEK